MFFFNDFYFLFVRKILIGSGKFFIFVMVYVLYDIFLVSKILELLKKLEKNLDILYLFIIKYDYRNYI